MTALVLGVSKQETKKPRYEEASFYICAHQDDWQLFMGADACNDIRSFDEKKAEANGRKVVIIYTTAGNLNDDNDKNTCSCLNAKSSKREAVAYWQVREQGAKNSVHFAACMAGDRGPGIPFKQPGKVHINGHNITRYQYKNVVSYFLRIKAGKYGAWYNDEKPAVGTVDNATTYTNRADLVHTLHEIFRAELSSEVASGRASFHFPDTDETINPNDHHDHLIAGRCAHEAVRSLSATTKTSFPASLYIDYHTENLPENITGPGAQNEAALTAVYCLALLDYNAWAEWGALYQKWTSRNYFRTVNVGDGGGVK